MCYAALVCFGSRGCISYQNIIWSYHKPSLSVCTMLSSIICSIVGMAYDYHHNIKACTSLAPLLKNCARKIKLLNYQMRFKTCFILEFPLKNNPFQLCLRLYSNIDMFHMFKIFYHGKFHKKKRLGKWFLWACIMPGWNIIDPRAPKINGV